MGFGRLRFQAHGFLKGGYGAFQVALFGKPGAGSIVDFC